MTRAVFAGKRPQPVRIRRQASKQTFLRSAFGCFVHQAATRSKLDYSKSIGLVSAGQQCPRRPGRLVPPSKARASTYIKGQYVSGFISCDHISARFPSPNPS
jgi:hypothetical protein